MLKFRVYRCITYSSLTWVNYWNDLEIAQFVRKVIIYIAFFFSSCIHLLKIVYNYPPKGRWIVVDIYRDAKRRGIYPPLFTDPEGDSCFSIYQIRWIKKRFLNFFFWNFRETTRHFSFRSQNSEYPRIFRFTGANQNARKLLSTDLVNTNTVYLTSNNFRFFLFFLIFVKLEVKCFLLML